jgi:transcriptional regulator NrdR family protein
MPSDPELDLRGRLVRRLGSLREMLPGSFIERARKCGKVNCRCAEGKELHTEFVLSVLMEGKHKTFHVPGKLVDDVRTKVQQRKLFEDAADQIARLNLRRFLRQKEK